MNTLANTLANNTTARKRKRTPTHDPAEAVNGICAELTAVCDAMYSRFDFEGMRAVAVAHGMEPTYRVGNSTVLRFSAAAELFDAYFRHATNWAALGEIFNRAKVPFVVSAPVDLDRYLDRKTGEFTLTTDGRPHSGDFSFGTVAGVSIGTVMGHASAVANAVHPTQQIVAAARAFMDERQARQDAGDYAAIFEALVRRGYGAGVAGKDRARVATRRRSPIITAEAFS